MLSMLLSLGTLLLGSAPIDADMALWALEKINKEENGITYTLSGGRFGDNLIAYLHARWLAYKHNLVFIYAPFPYSDQLKLHNESLSLENVLGLYKRRWKLRNEKDFPSLSRSTLIVVPYFPESEIELKLTAAMWPQQFVINWQDKNFKQLIRRLITPRVAVSLLEMPKEPCITVAVHVRRGGNFDPEGSDLAIPFKLPPDSFYIKAIRKMSEHFFHQNMYLYIFTDDLDPPKIMNRYKEALKDLTHITFDCRKHNNSPSVNVLEDFFSIQKFDCLIRPDSNYTIVAEKLKNFKLVISPESYHIENGIVYIDSLRIEKGS